MRLNIYDQFIVGVVRPDGGWSKGRPIAYIEDEDKCVPLFAVLIPNDLDDRGVARYVGDLFGAFAQTGKRVELLHSTATSHLTGTSETANAGLHTGTALRGAT